MRETTATKDIDLTRNMDREIKTKIRDLAITRTKIEVITIMGIEGEVQQEIIILKDNGMKVEAAETAATAITTKEKVGKERGPVVGTEMEG